MYKIEIDTTKKLIRLKLAGFIGITEMNSFASEFESTLKNFKPKEAMILGDMTDFKPASPDAIPVMQKVLLLGIMHCRKSAAIHKNLVSQMQFMRIGEEVQSNQSIKRFKSEEEALQYLFE